MLHLLNLRIIFCLAFLHTVFFSPLHSQGNSDNVASFEDVIQALEKQTYDHIQEKVYLHLDKPYYSKGDNLWFKAYTVAGPNHTPTPLSQNLYVELINQEQRVLKRLTVYMNKGLGMGDFILVDSLAAGNYTIRAYTNWMRNFDEDFYFQKQIKLIDPLSDEPLKKTEADSSLQIRFFPEGGELITNITSKVAFEIQNAPDGIQGQIIDDQGNIVSTFETSHQGMGSFNLKPVAGRTYFGKVNGASKHELPKVRNEGFSIAVDNLSNPDKIIVRIMSSDLSNIKKEAFLIAHTRGLVGFSSKIEWTGRGAKISIPKKNLTAGLVHITVFNSNWQPEAERLIFKAQRAETINISMVSDKQQYNIRDSTTIKLKLQDENGKPLIGFFSMSVFDSAQISPTAFEENIMSSFFLNADIKGNIQNSAQYFNANNSTADQDLDLLLMTKGWRRFVWKDILNENFPQNDYPVERGFKITGKVVHAKSKKPLKKGLVKQIGTFQGIHSFAETEIQNNGSFSIENLLYYETDILLQGENAKGNKNVVLSIDSMPLNNFSRFVALDKSSNQSTNLNILNTFSEKSNERKLFDEAYDNTGITSFIERKKERDLIDSSYNFKNSEVRNLGEVVVEGKTKNNSFSSNISRGYAFKRGTYSISVVDLMDRGQKFYNALYLLQGRIPGFTIIPSATGEPRVLMTNHSAGSGTPKFTIDDSPLTNQLGAVTALRPEMIQRIEVLKGVTATMLYGDQGLGGVIAFYTKTPDELDEYYDRLDEYNKVPDPKNSKRLNGGYYKSRQFYAPNYSSELPGHFKPDYRDLIHWEPMIETDENGEATIKFFNADLPTTIQINLEGIWEGGIPLASSISYEVKKK